MTIYQYKYHNGENDSIVCNQGPDLQIFFIRRGDGFHQLALVGKNGVYLNFLRKEQRKKVPKKRKTDRKKISGEYLQEEERSPPSLKSKI